MGKPIDIDGGAVVLLMEKAGGPGGEFERGGAAEAKVGDQEGASLF